MEVVPRSVITVMVAINAVVNQFTNWVLMERLVIVSNQ